MAKKRAFVRYSKQGKIVPGSLILTGGSYPQGPSTWREVPADLCCTTTTAAPSSALYEGTLTVGGPEGGSDFGYSDGSVTPNAYGNIAPSYPPLNLLSTVGGIAAAINLYLTDTTQYQYIELYVDNVLYTLTLGFSPPPFKIYSLYTTTNPFPPVGQTCTIKLVPGPLAP